MRKKLVEDATGLVVNVFEVSGGFDYPVPTGHTLFNAENAAPGDQLVGGTLVKKVAPVEPALDEIVEKMAAEPLAETLVDVVAAFEARIRTLEGNAVVASRDDSRAVVVDGLTRQMTPDPE